MTRVVQRAFRYRFYPTAAQAEQLTRTFGCVRLVYNMAAWYGRRLVLVDRWLPSSKRCSTCGRLAASMPLGVRAWTCPCGATHDRDVNAAINILAAGLVER